MDHTNAKKLIDFIRQSPTCFHAVDTIKRELKDFVPLQEQEKWRLAPGGKYYVVRNQSSIIAFTLPQGPVKAFQLIASHSDSPTFKIKENAEVSVRGKYIQLDTERYGGMIMSTWLDRPLSIAGRALVKTEKGVSTVLVNLEDPKQIAGKRLLRLNREHSPERVIIEYNATWLMNTLYAAEKPEEWELAQIIDLVDANTFELYLKNLLENPLSIII